MEDFKISNMSKIVSILNNYYQINTLVKNMLIWVIGHADFRLSVDGFPTETMHFECR